MEIVDSIENLMHHKEADATVNDKSTQDRLKSLEDKVNQLDKLILENEGFNPK